MRSRSTAHTHTVPPGGLGDAPRQLPRRARTCSGESRWPTSAPSRTVPSASSSASPIARTSSDRRRGLVAEDRERLERGHALGRRRQLGDVEAAEASRRAATTQRGLYSARSSRGEPRRGGDRLGRRTGAEPSPAPRWRSSQSVAASSGSRSARRTQGPAPSPAGARGLVRHPRAQLNPAGTPRWPGRSRARGSGRARRGRTARTAPPSRRPLRARRPTSARPVRRRERGERGGRPGRVDAVERARPLPDDREQSPPMPVECGSVTHRTAAAQIAASTAEPPSRRTSRPASVASGWLEATIASEATDAARAGSEHEKLTSTSGPRRAEPLGPDPARARGRPRTSQPAAASTNAVRPADVDQRPLRRPARRPRSSSASVDPAAVPAPVVRPLARQREARARAVASA